MSTYSGEPLDPTAPEYLVYPVEFHEIDPQLLTDEICVIGFGESFKTSEPPENVDIPESYRSPELILEQKVGTGSDLWALGCTLFAIRTGRKLFDAFFEEPDEQLCLMVKSLGAFPQRLWDIWERGERNFPKHHVEDQ